MAIVHPGDPSPTPQSVIEQLRIIRDARSEMLELVQRPYKIAQSKADLDAQNGVTTEEVDQKLTDMKMAVLQATIDLATAEIDLART